MESVHVRTICDGCDLLRATNMLRTKSDVYFFCQKCYEKLGPTLRKRMSP